MAGRSSGILGQAHSEEAATHQLQRWLSQEDAERDAARTVLQRLHATVEVHRQRLVLLLARPPGGGEVAISRAKEVVRDLEAEASTIDLADVSQGGALLPASMRSNHAVLSQSLKETQRQCDSLNREMVQQAESNEKLVESMGGVKAANKRLLEQIRGQSAEIAHMMQQRVADEERLEAAARRHEAQRETARQNLQQQVVSIRDSSTERQWQVQQRLSEKLQKLEYGSVKLRSGLGQLGKDLQERQQTVAELFREVSGWWQVWQKDVPAQLLRPVQKNREEKLALEKRIGELRSMLKNEREQRHQDNMDWGRKYGEMQTDKEDLQARLSRECSQLESRLQAHEKRQLEERQAWIEERARLESHCSEQEKQLDAKQVSLDQLHRQIAVSETALTSKVSETQSLDQVAAELQRQMRESDDALAAAVRSNEDLRGQLDEQRLRFQDKNNLELTDCRGSCERRLTENRRADEVESALALQQIEAMEDEIRASDEDLLKLQADHEASLQDIATSDADISSWRSHWDAENNGREALEKDFNAAKQAFNGELLTLQAMCNMLSGCNEDLEQEIRQISGDLVHKRRATRSREVESTTRQAAAEAQLKESQELLVSCRERLREVVDQRARVASEADAQRQQAIEVLSVMERNLENQVQILYTDRERYEAVLLNHRKVHEQAKEECEREKELASAALRQARSESRHRLEGMDKEKMRIEESRRSELAQGHEYVDHRQQRVEDMEQDVERVRSRLVESETSLGFLRQECHREERENQRLQRELEDEVRLMESQLERFRRDDTTLAKNWEAQRFRADQERRDVHQSLGEPVIGASSPAQTGSGRRWSSSEPVTAR